MSGHSARQLAAWLLLSVGAHALLLWPGAGRETVLPPPGPLQTRLLAPAPPVAAGPVAPAPRRLASPAGSAQRVATKPAAQPAASAAAGQPLALEPPPPGDWTYALRWQGEDGSARLRFELEGEHYRLSLQRGTTSRALPDWVSEGRLAAGGLQPERFRAGRREWQPAPRVQDRLSWIWQAAALARAQALQPGQRLLLQVQGWRGETQRWSLLAESDPQQPGWLRLRRELPEGALLEQLLWLDPAQAHRPVRLSLRFDANERWELRTERDISPTPAPTE